MLEHGPVQKFIAASSRLPVMLPQARLATLLSSQEACKGPVQDTSVAIHPTRQCSMLQHNSKRSTVAWLNITTG